LFNISSAKEFNELALAIFRYQATNNPVYGEFLRLLQKNPQHVRQISDIPFLPVELFKSKSVVTGNFSPEQVFTSSGTSGTETSRHLVRDSALYRKSYRRGFEHFYGQPKDYCILALLPSYLEREGSSLIDMAQGLITASGHPDSGFYLNDHKKLSEKLQRLEDSGQHNLLIGVSFALLDLAEQFPQHLPNTIIMETGGMKGRRKELTRNELHNQLKQAFGVSTIHSEYGMTELLSQAYSASDGRFKCPPWMQVLVRQRDDPFAFCTGKTGGINVIDLANIDSCSFIATSDLGRVESDGSFEVLGRFDYSDVRGCNLMVV
jgi:phenylacetate-coenzyme A ligase PaaK-like adenylate-forming protein